MAKQQNRDTAETDIATSHHSAALIGNAESVIFQLEGPNAPSVFDDAALASLRTQGFTAIAGGNLDNILRLNVTNFSTFDFNLDGGGGFNTISFAGSANGVTVDLTHLNGITIDNFQQIVGTDSRDILIGDDRAHVWDGGAGSNSIICGAGNDLVYSGNGFDSVTDFGGANTLSYERAALVVDNQGNPLGAIFNAVGNVVTFGTTLSTVYNANAFHSFIGTIYDDTFLGGKGDFNFDGGITGNDTLSFANFGGAITLTLTSYFTAQLDPNHIFYPSGFEGYGHDGFYTYEDTSGLYTGVFQNIDRYVGSTYDDRLFGGWSNDTLDGGAGNDYFRGGIGDDVLTGGVGNDLILAGPGSDIVYGGTDSDFLTGGISGDDVLYGGAGDDVIEEYSGRNTLTGGGGHDTFVFDTLIRASAQPSYLGEVHDTLNIVTDFHVGNFAADANADRLDLSPLLGNLFFQATALTAIDPAVTGSTSLTDITGFDIDANPTGTTLNQFVRVIQVNGGGDYHLQINVDGARPFAQVEGLVGGWTDVAILQGTRGATLSLDQLFANNEIIFAPHQQQSQAHGGTLTDYPYVLGDPNTAPYYHPALPTPSHP